MIARSQHKLVLDAIKQCGENYIAFGAGLTKDASRYVVCMQDLENGGYETKILEVDGEKERARTGASFVLFNASLKEGKQCSAGVLEDGVLVKMDAVQLSVLRSALQEMEDCEMLMQMESVLGGADAGDGEEEEKVVVKWIDDDEEENLGWVLR